MGTHLLKSMRSGILRCGPLGRQHVKGAVHVGCIDLAEGLVPRHQTVPSVHDSRLLPLCKLETAQGLSQVTSAPHPSSDTSGSCLV